MGESLWMAFALLLIVEGALPLAAPRLWRQGFSRLCTLRDGQLRFIGLAAVLAGAVSLMLALHD